MSLKSADWVIDMGPEGGDGGETSAVSGTPEKVASVKKLYWNVFKENVIGEKRQCQSQLL